MDFYQYHDKCRGGCGTKCLTRSGFCKKCRSYVCKRCNKDAVWFNFKKEYCSTCEALLVRQNRFSTTTMTALTSVDFTETKEADIK